MDSPSRQPVPQFGAWREYVPGSPTVDYSRAFARARASRLGSMPPGDEEDQDEYSFQLPEEETTNDGLNNTNRLPVVRSSSRRTFFHFFVCGSRRAQAVA